MNNSKWKRFICPNRVFLARIDEHFSLFSCYYPYSSSLHKESDFEMTLYTWTSPLQSSIFYRLKLTMALCVFLHCFWKIEKIQAPWNPLLPKLKTSPNFHAHWNNKKEKEKKRKGITYIISPTLTSQFIYIDSFQEWGSYFLIGTPFLQQNPHAQTCLGYMGLHGPHT